MTKPLKILALNHRCLRHPDAGGSEVNLFEQAVRWVKGGHQVTVVCEDPGRAYAPTVNEDFQGVQIRRMGKRYTVFLHAMRFLRAHGHEYDVILDTCNGVPFFSTLMTRTPSILMVHHVHGPMWFIEFGFPINRVGHFLESSLLRFLYGRQLVITGSPTTAADLLKIGFRKAQIKIIDYGVVTHPVSEPPASRSTPTILYVGRIKKYKRLDLLVNAVDALRHEFPEVHLDIVGTGSAADEIKALIAELGLNDHITLHGFVDEQVKANMLNSATVYATPSIVEGWGLSVIEANTYGCPAVAYDVPGLSASIVHDQTGLLVHSETEFCDAIASILREPSLRKRLSTAAREWSERFSWDNSAAGTLDIMQRVANPPPVIRAPFSFGFGSLMHSMKARIWQSQNDTEL